MNTLGCLMFIVLMIVLGFPVWLFGIMPVVTERYQQRQGIERDFN